MSRPLNPSWSSFQFPHNFTRVHPTSHFQLIQAAANEKARQSKLVEDDLATKRELERQKCVEGTDLQNFEVTYRYLCLTILLMAQYYINEKSKGKIGYANEKLGRDELFGLIKYDINNGKLLLIPSRTGGGYRLNSELLFNDNILNQVINKLNGVMMSLPTGDRLKEIGDGGKHDLYTYMLRLCFTRERDGGVYVEIHSKDIENNKLGYINVNDVLSDIELNNEPLAPAFGGIVSYVARKISGVSKPNKIYKHYYDPPRYPPASFSAASRAPSSSSAAASYPSRSSAASRAPSSSSAAASYPYSSSAASYPSRSSAAPYPSSSSAASYPPPEPAASFTSSYVPPPPSSGPSQSFGNMLRKTTKESPNEEVKTCGFLGCLFGRKKKVTGGTRKQIKSKRKSTRKSHRRSTRKSKPSQ